MTGVNVARLHARMPACMSLREKNVGVGLPVLFALGCLLAPARASAAWTKLSSGDSSVYLNAVSAPDRSHVFVVGDDINTSGSFPSLSPRVYASADGGQTFSDISGVLSRMSGLSSATALVFLDDQTGWVTVGNSIFKTVNGGSSWTTGVSLGFATGAISALDAMHLVAAGANGSISTSSNGGSSWTPASVPTTSDSMQSLFWLDSQHGWATGETTDDNGLVTTSDVFITADGGMTWSQAWSSMALGFGPIFLLPDGKTGWLAAFEQTDASSSQPDPNQATAHLLTTTDGGQSFQDISLPTSVGQITLLGMRNPIVTSRLWAESWADAMHGHLVGGAYMGSSSSSMSGGMTTTSQTTTYWKIIDYTTDNGGQTWVDTQLGSLTGSLTSPPPSDGTFSAAAFVDPYDGWIVGAADTVWGYEATCKGSTDCDPGYQCETGHCIAPSSAGDGGSGGRAGDAGPTYEYGADAATARSGCNCGSPGVTPALSLLLVFTSGRRRGHGVRPGGRR